MNTEELIRIATLAACEYAAAHCPHATQKSVADAVVAELTKSLPRALKRLQSDMRAAGVRAAKAAVPDVYATCSPEVAAFVDPSGELRRVGLLIQANG